MSYLSHQIHGLVYMRLVFILNDLEDFVPTSRHVHVHVHPRRLHEWWLRRQIRRQIWFRQKRGQVWIWRPQMDRNRWHSRRARNSQIVQFVWVGDLSRPLFHPAFGDVIQGQRKMIWNVLWRRRWLIKWTHSLQ